ncbi:hypothetical protein JQ615_41150 [Bradyrhizobium jicamae]|uniref:Phage tail protein n=1 Tax=Bradyrhizobium jicamae TaxID=280332 RepID=A0ABS5FZW6_9BRAD|nr:hypothetical protein [Bradyrhizobium jicamae]MBR0801751.1 hypothetical protein [Bradyrhizobium jicamae]
MTAIAEITKQAYPAMVTQSNRADIAGLSSPATMMQAGSPSSGQLTQIKVSGVAAQLDLVAINEYAEDLAFFATYAGAPLG